MYYYYRRNMRQRKNIYNIFTVIALAAIALTFLVPPAQAADYAMGKPPTTFRGMAWGTPLEELPELLPVKGIRYKNTYFRANESLTFGDAEITSVAYYFRKDKLYRVGVAFSGRANHFILKDQLLRMYGRGRGVGTRYGWMWPEFSVELDYDDEEKSGGLYYTFEGKLD